MPCVLFLVNLIEDGVYRCYVRVAFASVHTSQKFLSRHSVREKDGGEVLIGKGSSRGYDGKPLISRGHLAFHATSTPGAADAALFSRTDGLHGERR
jgi:hypothetical protein